MTFAGINYLAVVVAAVAAWLGSAVWYMSLSRLYVTALGKTPEQMAADRKKPWAFLPFVYAFVANVIIAWMLAGVLGHLGPAKSLCATASSPPRSCGSALSSPR